MKFVKMHGTGNDFVLMEAQGDEKDWPKLAEAMCDRHFGVGSDGLILVVPSAVADLRMRMFNPDGSEAEMCGNGIRCFAKYAVEQGLVKLKEDLTVETLAGIRNLHLSVREGEVTAVCVGMGAPKLAPTDIPVKVEGVQYSQVVKDYPLKIEERQLALTCVSMGNPHAVAFLEEPVEQFPLEVIGPKVEHHETFPRRTNFDVVNMVDRKHLTARVWERGAGLTLACGTGACAVAVAARLHGLIDDEVDITLPGGDLHISWDGRGEVYLSGPAETVFQGEWVK